MGISIEYITFVQNETCNAEYEIDAKTVLLMGKITKFFSNVVNFDIMESIVNQHHKISLRVLDWFVSTYAKAVNVNIEQDDGIVTNVYFSYLRQLEAFNKRRFDPFCRKNKLQLTATASTATASTATASTATASTATASTATASTATASTATASTATASTATASTATASTATASTATASTATILYTSCGQLCFIKWCIETKIIDYVDLNYDLINSEMHLRAKRYKDSIPVSKRMSKSKTKTRVMFD